MAAALISRYGPSMRQTDFHPKSPATEISLADWCRDNQELVLCTKLCQTINGRESLGIAEKERKLADVGRARDSQSLPLPGLNTKGGVSQVGSVRRLFKDLSLLKITSRV